MARSDLVRPRHATPRQMGRDDPDFIVVGERVALGPLRPDLAALYSRWMNQLDVRRG